MNQDGPSKSLEELLAEDGGEPGNNSDGRGPTPPDTGSDGSPDTPEKERQKQQAPEDAQEKLRATEERYRTLQSKYDAEVPRLAREKRELNEEVDRLKRQVSELETKLEKALAAPAVSDEDINAEMEKLREDFTDDAVDGFASLTKKLIARNLPRQEPADQQQRDAEIETLRKELARVKTNSALGQLDALVDGWRETNEDPEFIQWLADNTDWRSGQTYQDLMQHAWAVEGDIARVAQFFKEFKAERQQRDKPPESKPTNVEPDSSGGGHRPDPNAGTGGNEKIWTVAEVEDINRRARRGEFKGKEKQLSALREKIERAAAAGRLQ